VQIHRVTDRSVASHHRPIAIAMARATSTMAPWLLLFVGALALLASAAAAAAAAAAAEQATPEAPAKSSVRRALQQTSKWQVPRWQPC
jgi:hypothetical protein